jgi:hypothetical protein
MNSFREIEVSVYDIDCDDDDNESVVGREVMSHAPVVLEEEFVAFMNRAIEMAGFSYLEVVHKEK